MPHHFPPFFDQWVMPGGKVGLGEPILRALHREVREEIGIDVTVEALVDIFEHLTPSPENDHFVILYYRCRPLRRDLVANEAEVSEARWVPRTGPALLHHQTDPGRAPGHPVQPQAGAPRIPRGADGLLR